MEPMMIRADPRATRGRPAESASTTVSCERVREYIDHTTGVQTLVQMQGLVEMVREFGVRARRTRSWTQHGYKAHLQRGAAWPWCGARLAKLARGELAVEDFTAQERARASCARLRAAGVQLYLASGTDQQDVERRSRGPGLRGPVRAAGSTASVGRRRRRRPSGWCSTAILADIGPRGGAAAGHLRRRAGGDPRDATSAAGLAVGVASDEVRRFGLNPSKRARLIRAGADVDRARLLPVAALPGSLLHRGQRPVSARRCSTGGRLRLRPLAERRNKVRFARDAVSPDASSPAAARSRQPRC